MTTSSPDAPSGSQLPPRVGAYVDDVVAACAAPGGAPGGPLVSLVLFGSAATGGYAARSDVDLLIVVADDADAAERRRVREVVPDLEARHGLSKPRGRAGALGGALAAFADRVAADVGAFRICTRAALLSGDPGRILGLPPAQARFVDRIALPSILASGVTLWGEVLLDAVPLPPIRRVDVAKAWFGLSNQALLAATWYPLLPEATKYAMDALKRSVHNCYFCYHGRPAPLAEEVAFFTRRHGPDATLARLLALRREYRPSYGFVLACLPALARLHGRTARDVSFPRAARVPGPVSPVPTRRRSTE